MDFIDFPCVISSFLKPNDRCCMNIVKTEGLAAVMKGVRAPVYAQSLNNAILFGTERFCDRNINIEVNRWYYSSEEFNCSIILHIFNQILSDHSFLTRLEIVVPKLIQYKLYC